jgi:hypothetical protein
MLKQELSGTSTTEGLPVAPSLGYALQSTQVRGRKTFLDGRVLFSSGLNEEID